MGHFNFIEFKIRNFMKIKMSDKRKSYRVIPFF